MRHNGILLIGFLGLDRGLDPFHQPSSSSSSSSSILHPHLSPPPSTPPPSTLSLRSSPTILCFYNRLVVRHSQRVRWFVPPGIACPLWDWASWGYRIIGPVWDWASGITCPMWDWASWIIGLHVQCGTGPLGLWNYRSSVGLGLLYYGIIGPVWDWAS